MSTTESVPTGGQPVDSASADGRPAGFGAGPPVGDGAGDGRPTVNVSATDHADPTNPDPRTSNGQYRPRPDPASVASATRATPALGEVLGPADQERRRRLNKIKAVATGALVLLAVIFVIAFALEQRHPWLGYVRAMAEAGMVGALADWFAVTALFRRPLGLPIPHT